MHLFVGAPSRPGRPGLPALRLCRETAFESEPPFLALSVLLIGIGTGLALRARAALLLTQVALGGTLLVIATRSPPALCRGTRDTPDDSLVALVYLFGFALAAAGVVVLFLLLRRVHAEAAFGAIDYVPLGGLAAALVLGLVWLGCRRRPLRPCRNGSDEACSAVAIAAHRGVRKRVLGLPTRAEDARGARVAEHHCRSVARGPCGLQRYAAGIVRRSGRPIRRGQGGVSLGCETDRSWCARAADGGRALDGRRAQATQRPAALASLQRVEHACGEALQIGALDAQHLELENHAVPRRSATTTTVQPNWRLKRRRLQARARLDLHAAIGKRFLTRCGGILRPPEGRRASG